MIRISEVTAFYSAQQALSNTECASQCATIHNVNLIDLRLADPTRDVLAVLGCNPTTQDHIAWPAWVCIMIAEICAHSQTMHLRHTAFLLP